MRGLGVLFVALVALLLAGPAAAQDRPLATQDPETIGGGDVQFAAGVSYSRRDFYPLTGIQGNLWQLPVLRLDVGLSSIADLQISGGPYDRLSITERLPAPFASIVNVTGDTTHSVDDIQIGTKIRLIPEGKARPSVGFRFSVRLPNSKRQSGLGQDTTDFSASLLAGKTVARTRLLGNVGFTIMTEPLNGLKQNDVVIYGAALSQGITRRMELVGEVNGRWSTRDGVAPIGTESRALTQFGGRYTCGAVRLDAALFFGLTPIDPSVGVTAGVTLHFHAFSLP